MRFLIDADLPRALRPVIEQHGHKAIDVRDIGLGTVPDPAIAAFARLHRACLLTGDFGFADLRNYSPAEYGGIAVLVLPAPQPQPPSSDWSSHCFNNRM